MTGMPESKITINKDNTRVEEADTTIDATNDTIIPGPKGISQEITNKRTLNKNDRLATYRFYLSIIDEAIL
jgi:hypothetical protein